MADSVDRGGVGCLSQWSIRVSDEGPCGSTKPRFCSPREINKVRETVALISCCSFCWQLMVVLTLLSCNERPLNTWEEANLLSNVYIYEQDSYIQKPYNVERYPWTYSNCIVPSSYSKTSYSTLSMIGWWSMLTMLSSAVTGCWSSCCEVLWFAWSIVGTHKSAEVLT